MTKPGGRGKGTSSPGRPASTRNIELPDGHPLQCTRPDCKTKRRVSVPVGLCAAHRQQLARGTLLLDGIEADASLLPEDGVFDPIAVDIAARGYRVVKLTHRERLVATALIMEGPGQTKPMQEVVHDRLGVPRNIAARLIEQVTESGIDVSGVEFYGADVNIQETAEAS